LEQAGTGYTADMVIAEFTADNAGDSFFSFMESVIANMKELGKTRLSETYASTLNSFRRFRGDKDLEADGISPNSSSFYMRNLRAVYNRAVEKDLTAQRFPFRHVYTGVEKTVKRAIPLEDIRQIRGMDLSISPALDFACDMFLFSFYTRGMSFVDMAYLLPVIRPDSGVEERKQYIYAAHNVNCGLKAIGRELGLSVTLTLYVARHAWASIARSKNVPLSVISVFVTA